RGSVTPSPPKPFGNPVEPEAIKTLTWPDANLIMTCRVVSERLHRCGRSRDRVRSSPDTAGSGRTAPTTHTAGGTAPDSAQPPSAVRQQFPIERPDSHVGQPRAFTVDLALGQNAQIAASDVAHRMIDQ